LDVGFLDGASLERFEQCLRGLRQTIEARAKEHSNSRGGAFSCTTTGRAGEQVIWPRFVPACSSLPWALDIERAIAAPDVGAAPSDIETSRSEADESHKAATFSTTTGRPSAPGLNTSSAPDVDWGFFLLPGFSQALLLDRKTFRETLEKGCVISLFDDSGMHAVTSTGPSTPASSSAEAESNKKVAFNCNEESQSPTKATSPLLSRNYERNLMDHSADITTTSSQQQAGCRLLEEEHEQHCWVDFDRKKIITLQDDDPAREVLDSSCSDVQLQLHTLDGVIVFHGHRIFL
ncbi:unnamed protein product, partial [Amoebophrya sp. A120]